MASLYGVLSRSGFGLTRGPFIVVTYNKEVGIHGSGSLCDMEASGATDGVH